MRTLDFTDLKGRHWRVQLPDDAGDDEVDLGVPVGPPDLEPLALAKGWPESFAVRLHNELWHRGLLTKRDAQARSSELIGAFMAALKADAMDVARLYAGEV